VFGEAGFRLVISPVISPTFSGTRFALEALGQPFSGLHRDPFPNVCVRNMPDKTRSAVRRHSSATEGNACHHGASLEEPSHSMSAITTLFHKLKLYLFNASWMMAERLLNIGVGFLMAIVLARYL
jgi:hypothetical protein